MRLIQQLFFTFLLILAWTQEAQAGSCRDPWITQVFQTSTKLDMLREPSGSGDYGECNYKLYNNGSWGSYDELENAIVQVMKPNPYAMCRDPWITMVYLSRYNTYPAGNGDTGDCDYTRYNNGSWSSFQELDDAIQKVRNGATTTTAPPPPSDLALSVDKLDFGAVALGATSQTQSVTLSNPGTAAISFEHFGTGSTPCDFTLADSTCSSVIAPGQSCTIKLVFKPSKTGTETDTLTLNYNGNKVKTVALSGTALDNATCSAPPSISYAPIQLDFKNTTAVYQKSSEQAVRIKNNGACPLSFERVYVRGNIHFEASSSGNPSWSFKAGEYCKDGLSLKPGEYCDAGVIFYPHLSGAQTDELVIKLVGGASLTSVDLRGTAIAPPPAPDLALSAVKLDFGAVALGSTSQTQSVTLSNPGATAISFEHFGTGSTPSDFTLADSTCSSVIAPGQSCTIKLAFKPSKEGTSIDTLTLKFNGGKIKTVALSGTAAAAAAKGSCRDPWINQAFLTSTKVGLKRAPSGSDDEGECNYKLYNHGSWSSYAELEEAIAEILHPDPALSCRDPWITMSFRSALGREPVGKGDSGECNYLSYLGGHWLSFAELNQAIVGMAAQPADVAATLPDGKSSVTFNQTADGAASPPKMVTLANRGKLAVEIRQMAASPPSFDIGSESCGLWLAPGESCTLELVYQPTATDTDETGSLLLDLSSGKQSIPLVGSRVPAKSDSSLVACASQFRVDTGTLKMPVIAYSQGASTIYFSADLSIWAETCNDCVALDGYATVTDLTPYAGCMAWVPKIESGAGGQFNVMIPALLLFRDGKSPAEATYSLELVLDTTKGDSVFRFKNIRVFTGK